MDESMVCNKNKKIVLVLLLIFLAALLAYGFVAFQQVSTRSGRVDETLYINMARSFHYENNFTRNGAPTGYDCILYSIILSVCYFFYSPDSIITLMRLMGVFIMCTVVFPTYLLSVKILNSRKQAIYMSVFSVLFPSMTISYYVYQETLLYPLVLWFLYYLYCTMEQTKYRYQAIAGALIYLLYNTKTICMYVLAAYVLFLAIDGFARKDFKRTAISILSACSVFLALYAMVRFGIFFLNEFQTLQSHYDMRMQESIQVFFGNIPYYMPQIIRGTLFYIYYTLLSVLAFPILMPISGYKSLDIKDRRLLLFCLLSVIMAILLIMGGIFLIEDSDRNSPMFHLRYYFAFLIPFIILTFKLEPNNFKLHPAVFAGLLALFTLPFVMPDGLVFFSAYVDNFLFIIFMGVTMKLGTYAPLLLGALLAAYSVCVLLLPALSRKKLLGRKTLGIILALFFVVAIIMDNYIVLNYKNESEMERHVDADVISLSRFLTDDGGISAFIDEHGVYHRAINYNTRLKDDYYHYYISEAEDGLLQIDDKVEYVIIPNGMNTYPDNCEKVEIGLFTVSLYRLNDSGMLALSSVQD